MNRFYNSLGQELNVTDDTLTMPGVPAESKTVGEYIIKNELLFARPVYTCRREAFWGEFRFCGITYDTKRNCFYIIGGAFGSGASGESSSCPSCLSPSSSWGNHAS